MDCPPVFGITFSIKTSQTVTIFETIKNFIPEILEQLDMELKLFHIWHLKSGAKFPETIKMSSSLKSFKTKIRNRNQDAIAAFVQHICTILVLSILFSFYLFWFVDVLVLYISPVLC